MVVVGQNHLRYSRLLAPPWVVAVDSQAGMLLPKYWQFLWLILVVVALPLFGCPRTFCCIFPTFSTAWCARFACTHLPSPSLFISWHGLLACMHIRQATLWASRFQQWAWFCPHSGLLLNMKTGREYKQDSGRLRDVTGGKA